MWKVKQVAVPTRKLFGSPCLGVGALAIFSVEEFKHFLVKERSGVKQEDTDTM